MRNCDERVQNGAGFGFADQQFLIQLFCRTAELGSHFLSDDVEEFGHGHRVFDHHDGGFLHELVEVVLDNAVAAAQNVAQFRFKSVRVDAAVRNAGDEMHKRIFELHFASEEEVEHDGGNDDSERDLHCADAHLDNQDEEGDDADERENRVERHPEGRTVVLDSAFAQNDDGDVCQDEREHDDGRGDGDEAFEVEEERGCHHRARQDKRGEGKLFASVDPAEECGNELVAAEREREARGRHDSGVCGCDERHHRAERDDPESGLSETGASGCVGERGEGAGKFVPRHDADRHDEAADVDQCDRDDAAEHSRGNVADGILDLL